MAPGPSNFKSCYCYGIYSLLSKNNCVYLKKKKIRKAVSFSDSCISMHNWIPSPLYTRFSFSLSPRGSWKVSRQCSELAEKIMHGEVWSWSPGEGMLYLRSVEASFIFDKVYFNWKIKIHIHAEKEKLVLKLQARVFKRSNVQNLLLSVQWQYQIVFFNRHIHNTCYE